MDEIASADARLTASVRERWDGGGIVDITLEALRPIAGWQLDADLGGEVVNVWNAEIAAQTAGRVTFVPTMQSAALEAGATLEFGLQISGPPEVRLVAFEVTPSAPAATDGAAEPDPEGVPDDAAATAGDGSVTLTPKQVIEEPPAQYAIADTVVTEPAGPNPEAVPPPPPATPFSTDGARIVDAEGAVVVPVGLNWFGLETETEAPHGLWARNWRELMEEVKFLGFDTLRIPFSGEAAATGGTPSGIDPALNPDLENLSSLEILDKIVDYAADIGLYVLLDYHRGAPGDGPNESGLWFGDGRTEDDVIAEWRIMAERYGEKPAVIGADLMNEPFGGTWGDGAPTDWAAAAERIGNEVLSVAPDWLIVVEGIADHGGESYWWGGNLRGAADRPVVLDRPDKLVYSAHDYPPSVHPQAWFEDGSDLESVFRDNWGFLVEQNIAPVLIGEWGSRLETEGDMAWATALSGYMETLDIPWLWWSLNPNSGDTGGLFQDDWATPRAKVMDLFAPFIEPAPGVADGVVAEFRITAESLPQDGDIVRYSTADGTATHGEDFVAARGALTFAPGERSKTVTIPILPDGTMEGDEFFYLVLGPSDGLRASATAIIADDEPDRRAALPFVDVASAVIGDGGTARFRVVFSEPPDAPVALDYKVSLNGESLAGRATIPAGAQEAILRADLPEEQLASGHRFTLELTAADGAAIRTGSASAIAAGGEPKRLVAVGPVATEETQLTIDLIRESDWGTGALFNVLVRNVSSAPVDGWQLALDLPFDLEQLWNAVAQQDGERTVLSNMDWNGAIMPGKSITFGFVTDAGGLSAAEVLSGADLEVVIQ